MGTGALFSIKLKEERLGTWKLGLDVSDIKCAQKSVYVSTQPTEEGMNMLTLDDVQLRPVQCYNSSSFYLTDGIENRIFKNTKQTMYGRN